MCGTRVDVASCSGEEGWQLWAMTAFAYCPLNRAVGSAQRPLSSSGEVTPGQDRVAVIPEQIYVLQLLKTLLAFGVCLIIPLQWPAQWWKARSWPLQLTTSNSSSKELPLGDKINWVVLQGSAAILRVMGHSYEKRSVVILQPTSVCLGHCIPT